MKEFKIGDEIYHKSHKNRFWIIEKISDNKLTCSSWDEKEKKQIRKEFLYTSVSKRIKVDLSSLL